MKNCGDDDLNNLGRIIGYSDAQLNDVPDGANLGLGFGNPLAIASLKMGDVFLASRKVDNTGLIMWEYE